MKSLCLDRKRYFYAKTHILQRVRECPLDIAHILKILPTNFKYNIAPYNLTLCKTKQPRFIYG